MCYMYVHVSDENVDVDVHQERNEINKVPQSHLILSMCIRITEQPVH